MWRKNSEIRGKFYTNVEEEEKSPSSHDKNAIEIEGADNHKHGAACNKEKPQTTTHAATSDVWYIASNVGIGGTEEEFCKEEVSSGGEFFFCSPNIHVSSSVPPISIILAP